MKSSDQLEDRSTQVADDVGWRLRGSYLPVAQPARVYLRADGSKPPVAHRRLPPMVANGRRASGGPPLDFRPWWLAGGRPPTTEHWVGQL